MPVDATETVNKTFVHLINDMNDTKTNFKRKMVNHQTFDSFGKSTAGQTLDSFGKSTGFEK